MKDKLDHKKIIIGVVVFVILIVIVIVLIYFKKNEQNGGDDEKKPTTNQGEVQYNTNQKVVEDKNINNIVFTDIKCSYDGYNSILEYTITNRTSEVVNLGEYEIVVKDKDGVVIANLSPILDVDIAPGESQETGNAINMDLSNAYEIELVLD